MTGDDIRRWRALNRIKQEALAAMLGVSHVAVSKWENGHSRPSRAMALRLGQIMAGAHDGQLAAEIAFTAPQRQIKALTRGTGLELVAVSAGYRALWPGMDALIGQDMRPLLVNEAQHYCDGSDLFLEAMSGELLTLTGVSSRFLGLGGDVPDGFRLRWHTIVRRIDGDLIHEMIFEPCAPGTAPGFERLLRRADIHALHA